MRCCNGHLPPQRALPWTLQPHLCPAPGSSFGRSAAAALHSWRARRGLPLDITCLPGMERLGRKERELCAMSRMLPVHYLALKDMMMRDCGKHGAVTRQEVGPWGCGPAGGG